MTEKFGKFTLNLLPDLIIAGQSRPPNKTEDVAAMLLSTLHFARDKEDNLYVYEEGVYRLVDKDIQQCSASIFAKYGIKWTSTKINEVDKYLIASSKTPLLNEVPDRGMIHLKNGTYFITEGKFEPHEDEFEHWKYLNVTQVPIIYDPGATCPEVLKFMDEVFPKGGNLLIDIIGICMTSSTANHKAIILLGEGNNGKSAYLYCLRAAVGHKNVSSTPIHKLADPNERFANNDLVGKLVNATDDVAQGKLLDAANIKSIISGNQIRVEGKFRTPVSYTPFCKLIFGANHRLESSDESMGYQRRIMHIPFTQTFALNPNKEKELHALFDDPKEMSGLFNEVTKRLAYTLERGFIIPEEVCDLVDNYDPIPDVSKQWILANVFDDPEGKIPVHEFCGAYNYILFSHQERQEVIYKYLKHLLKDVRIARPRVGKERKQVRCFIGIRVSDEVKVWMERIAPEGANTTEEEG